MELSTEVQKLLERCRNLQKQSQESLHGERVVPTPNFQFKSEDDLIDIEQIHFSDDESWLCRPQYESNKIKDLHAWLYQSEVEDSTNDEFHQQQLQMMREMAKIDCKKSIDSRTFTRPKKRYSRPSIEKYNEDIADINKTDNNNTYSSLLAAKLQEMELEQDDNGENSNTFESKPLNFDLTQPTNTSIFDKILGSVPELDSFQNMSPPSLINSMCSSTFTTLMENSYIKNDPVLREIRDTDYSETVLLQDSDPPMFQSFSESCSSLNSELTETFIKKISDSTFTNSTNCIQEQMSIMTEAKQTSVESIEDQLSPQSSTNASVGDVTYKLSSSDLNTDDLCNNDDIATPKNLDLIKRLENLGIQDIDPYSTITLSTTQHNGTYRKSSKHSSASKNIMDFSTDSLDNGLNSTYNKSPSVSINRSQTFKKQSRDSFENRGNNTIILNEGLDDLSYCSPEQKQNGISNNDLNRTMQLKRNSVGYSGGSADSLDAMSSLSNTSSRGSNKMLNMAEVDAIVELQEQSLQIMSTPKANSSARKICDTLHLSPITTRTERSDSDLSSSDDYATVRSKLSPATSDPEIISYGGNRSLKTQSAMNVEQPRKSVHTVARDNSRPLQPARYSRGSYTSLKNLGAATNLQKTDGKLRGSYTNLKSVGSNLRGSYTSLKPVNAILPVAPPPLNSTKVVASDTYMNRTVTLDANGKADETFKVPLSNRTTNQAKPVGDSKVVKAHSRGSSLPRPVGSSTGIPRPVSKIPGPRTIRPVSSRPALHPGGHANEEYY